MVGVELVLCKLVARLAVLPEAPLIGILIEFGALQAEDLASADAKLCDLLRGREGGLTILDDLIWAVVIFNEGIPVAAFSLQRGNVAAFRAAVDDIAIQIIHEVTVVGADQDINVALCLYFRRRFVLAVVAGSQCQHRQ